MTYRDPMIVLGEACGLRLVRVGEVEEPPLPSPKAARRKRKPTPLSKAQQEAVRKVIADMRRGR